MAYSEKITFANDLGITLAGRLEMPSESPRFFAIFAHCFTCSKDIAAASRISRGLTDHGIGVLRFDFTGLGNSDGDFANSNFSSNIQDLLSADEFLNKNYQSARLLVGHSLGGAAVLMAAHHLPHVKAVATIGAPFDPEHVAKNFKANLHAIKETGSARVKLGVREFMIKKEFLDDLQSQESSAKLATLKKAILIFHSPQDTIVNIKNAQDIYTHTRHPKSFVSLDGADHLLSRRQDSTYVASVLAAWASRYVDESIIENTNRQLQDSSVVVEEWDKTLSQKIRIRDHYLVADEPTDIPGGRDKGPTPYELLLAGLGACTAMTLRMYAKRKNIRLEGIKVTLSHSKIHAGDCSDCETKTGLLDQLSKSIELTGEISPEEKEKLLEISKKCPVHRTLLSEIKITTQLD